MKAMFKILLLACHSSKLTGHRMGKEIRTIEGIVRHADGILLKVVHDAIGTDISRYITKYRPQLLHISAEGEFSHGKTSILMADGQGFDLAELAKQVEVLNKRTQQPLRYLLLNACHSAGAGVALAKVFDAIISHQGLVLERAAQDLAHMFYRHLINEFDLESIFQLCRSQVKACRTDTVRFHLKANLKGQPVYPLLAINAQQPREISMSESPTKDYGQFSLLKIKSTIAGEARLEHTQHGRTCSFAVPGGSKVVQVRVRRGKYQLLFKALDGPTIFRQFNVNGLTHKSFKPLLPDITPPPPIMGVELKSGSFVMGLCSRNQGHHVTLTRGFWMATTPVTQDLWYATMFDCPWVVKPGEAAIDPLLPATGMSWELAEDFIRVLNELDASRLYRLPTEAEWEYACRAGSETIWSCGNDASLLNEYAWCIHDLKANDSRAHRVKQLKANQWGLFDMHGNVSEWCADWYAPFMSTSTTDPWGPPEGQKKVIRGGCVRDQAHECRSAARAERLPQIGDQLTGLRLVWTEQESDHEGDNT